MSDYYKNIPQYKVEESWDDGEDADSIHYPS